MIWKCIVKHPTGQGLISNLRFSILGKITSMMCLIQASPDIATAQFVQSGADQPKINNHQPIDKNQPFPRGEEKFA